MCHFDYRLLKYKQQRPYCKNDMPSSTLFEWIVPQEISQKASKAQDFFGINRTVYGVTQANDGAIDYELYYYYPNLYPKHSLATIINFLNIKPAPIYRKYNEQYLTSFKIGLDKQQPLIDVYETNLSCSHEHSSYIKKLYKGFYICTKCLSCTKTALDNEHEKNYYSLFYNRDGIGQHIENITTQLWNKRYNVTDIIPADLLEYEHDTICIAVKPNNTIGIYFSRISALCMFKFLKKYNFNIDFTKKLLLNINSFTHLLFDIGYNVKLDSQTKPFISKLGFYGVF
jgi:hypothetical protein